MCLLVLAWRAHPRYRLVVAANRDEYHGRPAAAMGPWNDLPILAGRDLEAGGTWLGVDRARRFGVVTNFREMVRRPAGAPSRGGLVPAWLKDTRSLADHAASLHATAADYAGFNLLFADRDSLYYLSNRLESFSRPLASGVHGLANHYLDTPWPKLLRVRHGLERWLGERNADPRSLFALLADRAPASDGDLPDTGLSPEWERALSAPFVVHGEYGTRCSTVLALGHDDSLQIEERSWDATGRLTDVASYRLGPEDWPAGNPPAPAQL